MNKQMTGSNTEHRKNSSGRIGTNDDGVDRPMNAERKTY